MRKITPQEISFEDNTQGEGGFGYGRGMLIE